jgi:uncharacterized membrane protein HdeD (DUF308 family)
MDWKEKVEKAAKRSLTGGIVAAIVMIVLGLCILCNPGASLDALVWLLIVGLMVGGVFRIVSYGEMPYWFRPGYSLVTGIMDVICGIMLAVAAVNSPAVTYDVFTVMVGFMFAFGLLVAGVNELSSIGVIQRMGGSAGWATFSAIIDILAAILLFMSPVASTAILMYTLAFALIAAGISVLSASLDVKNRAKAFGSYVDSLEEPFDPDNDPFISWKRH